jgi:hypothetical protein
MKRLLLIAGLAIAAIGLSAAPVLANNGVQVTHYGVSPAVTYTDPFFGPVSCTGVHQTGKNFPGTDNGAGTATGGQDSFTCTSTSGLPLTNVTPNEALSLAVIGGWISDYDGQLANSFAGTVSSDDFSYTAVAGYPNS